MRSTPTRRSRRARLDRRGRGERAAVAATLGAGARSGARAPPAGITVFAASSLTNVFPAIDSGAEVLVRRLEHARGADHARRAGRRVRLRQHDDPGHAVRQGARRAAGRLHAQHARDRRAEVQPGGHPLDLRPDQARRHDRHRELGRSGRLLHAADPEPDEPHQGGARERRQPGDRRARRCSRRSRSARSTPASSTRPTRRRCPAR